MSDDRKYQAFADALGALYKQHGVMIWSNGASGVFASPVGDDEKFRYAVERSAGGKSRMIRRVLGEDGKA